MAASLAFVLLFLSSSCVVGQEQSEEPERSPFVATKIDVLCSKALGCISDCQQDAFCLDERLSPSSPSYILNDQILLLRAQLIRQSNDSVVGLIHESFAVPLSFFSSETFEQELSSRQAIQNQSLFSLVESFSELQALDESVAGLKVGDPYCVWQRNLFSFSDVGDCRIDFGEDGPLGVGTAFQTTGSFGFRCGVRRFGRNRRRQ